MATKKKQTQNGKDEQKEVTTAVVHIKDGVGAADLMIQNKNLDPVQIIGEQIKLVTRLYTEHLRNGVDYGVVPGVNKPGLLKPGAEKITFMFRMVPKFQVQKEYMPDGHREYEVTCTLCAKGGTIELGQGVGSATTMESKYRFRNAKRKCPKCGADAIIKGKEEYGGGWLCYGKKGGCGAKFIDGAPEIEEQQVGKVENENIADVYNTVLKMAKKRAYVDATLTVTGVSDIFTQDVEDIESVNPVKKPPPVAADFVDVEPPEETYLDELPPPPKKTPPPAPKPEDSNKARNIARQAASKELNALYEKKSKEALDAGAKPGTKEDLLAAVFMSVGTKDIKGKKFDDLTEQEYWEVRKAAKNW